MKRVRFSAGASPPGRRPLRTRSVGRPAAGERAARRPEAVLAPAVGEADDGDRGVSGGVDERRRAGLERGAARPRPRARAERRARRSRAGGSRRGRPRPRARRSAAAPASSRRARRRARSRSSRARRRRTGRAQGLARGPLADDDADVARSSAQQLAEVGVVEERRPRRDEDQVDVLLGREPRRVRTGEVEMNAAARASTPRSASAAQCTFRAAAAAPSSARSSSTRATITSRFGLRASGSASASSGSSSPPAEADGEDRAPPRAPRRELERRDPGAGSPAPAPAARGSGRSRARRPAPSRGAGSASSASAWRPDRYSASISCAEQALAEGMLGDERLELRHELRMLPEREVGVDPPLDRQQVQLLEARDRRLRERLVGEIGERGPAPERERLAQQLGGRGGIGRAGLLDEALEAVDVELLGVEPERRSRARRVTRQRGAGAERLAQPRDARLERRRTLLRRLARPQLLDQPVRRDDLVRVEEQEARAGCAAAGRAAPRRGRRRAPRAGRGSGTPSRPPGRVCRLSVSCKRPIHCPSQIVRPGRSRKERECQVSRISHSLHWLSPPRPSRLRSHSRARTPEGRPARRQLPDRAGPHPERSDVLDDRRLLAPGQGRLLLRDARAGRSSEAGRSARSQLPDRAGPHPERGHLLDRRRLLAPDQGRLLLRDAPAGGCLGDRRPARRELPRPGRASPRAQVTSWTVGRLLTPDQGRLLLRDVRAGRDVLHTDRRLDRLQWGDAGIGAGFTLGIVLLLGGAGAGLLISRRNGRQQAARA